jgi:hypothetical protein
MYTEYTYIKIYPPLLKIGSLLFQWHPHRRHLLSAVVTDMKNPSRLPLTKDRESHRRTR